MISDEVIDALVASGATAEMIAAAVKASRSKAKTGAERQAAYMARKKAALTEVTKTDEVRVSERQSVTTKGFPLSPVPLLSPTPPNNPLTPNPLSKNSFGPRDFGDWPDDFRTQFWAKWPHRVGKPAAMRSLYSCRKRGVSWVVLMDGVDRYMRTKPPDRAWLNPATFLNQDRFDDQPAESHNGKTESLASVAKRQADSGISFGPRPTGLRLVESGPDVRLLSEAGRERS